MTCPSCEGTGWLYTSSWDDEGLLFTTDGLTGHRGCVLAEIFAAHVEGYR